MANKTFVYSLFFVLFTLMTKQAIAQQVDLKTLFTTPQERQLINSNRYHVNQPLPTPVTPEPVMETEKIQELVKELVTKNFTVSGISVDREGSRFAWVNGTMYSNNSALEDGLTLMIKDGKVKSVLIKTAEGEYFSGLTGETIEVSYRKAVNQ